MQEWATPTRTVRITKLRSPTPDALPAAGAVTLTLTTAKAARALAPEELELAAGLEKVA